MKLIKLIVAAAFLCLTGSIHAQQLKTGTTYNTAVGVRALGTSGLSVKHFTNRSTALEGIVGFYPNSFSVTLMLERYSPAFDVAGLNWYYGLGGHMASRSDFGRYDGRYRRETSELGLGVDGIFGIEYKIDRIPIAVSLDFKPFLEVATDGHAFMALDPGLGIKVTF